MRANASRDVGEADDRPGQEATPRPHPPLATPRDPARVAAAQLCSTADADANFAAVARLAHDAAGRGCSILFLPEAFSFLGPTPADTVAAAEPLEAGPRLRRYRDLAASLGIWLTGCVPEAGAPPGPGGAPRCWNTAVVVDAAGRLCASYRKLHLFDAEGLVESCSTAPGASPPPVVPDAPCGPLGLSICFDLRFAGLYDRLQYGGGGGGRASHRARVIAVPSAFTVPTGAAHWEVLLRARAIECQAVVVAAAQVGEHAPGGRRSYGHTAIFDAWGRALARVGGADPGDEAALSGEGLAIADLTPATVEDVRARMPLAAARAKGLEAVGL